VGLLAYKLNTKSKAVPVPTRRRQRERKYSSYSFVTSALDGVSAERHAPTALYPRGKDPLGQSDMEKLANVRTRVYTVSRN
jgi:hypothetical protein